MKLRSLFIGVFIFALSACNLPSNAPTATPTLSLITPSATQSPATATATLTAAPSDTPPPTATSTPTVPVAFAKEQAVNCRLGPNMGWIVLSGLNVGVSSQIVGKTADGGWWYIVDPFNSGRKCWVATSVTNTAGNLAGIPVAAAPEMTVTNLSVSIDPKEISVAGCVGPLQPSKIKGTIETNGPGTVKWHFETQQGGAMSARSTEFDTFGSQDVSTEFTPLLSAGTYWVRLVVTEPNNMQAETKYTITCP